MMLFVRVEDDGSLPFEATDSSLHSSLGRDHFDAVQHSRQTFAKLYQKSLDIKQLKWEVVVTLP